MEFEHMPHELFMSEDFLCAGAFGWFRVVLLHSVRVRTRQVTLSENYMAATFRHLQSMAPHMLHVSEVCAETPPTSTVILPLFILPLPFIFLHPLFLTTPHKPNLIVQLPFLLPNTLNGHDVPQIRHHRLTPDE